MINQPKGTDMHYVFSWSRHLAEDNTFLLVLDAKDEKDARKQVRDRFNVRTTRNCFLMPADDFRRDLERLVALNEQGKGVMRLLDGRRQVLARLAEEVAVS